MRTHRSPDLSVLRIRGRRPARPSEHAERRRRSSRSAAPTSADLRWPGGVECPRCSEHSPAALARRRRSKWHCYACRYQFSVTAGTLFHSSHLPVWKWFVAVHLMLESPDGRLGERASADARRELQDRVVRGPPDPGRDARPRAPSCCAASSRPSCTAPEPSRPPSRSSWPAPTAGCVARMRRARRRPAPPAQRQVPPGLHRRAALALGEPRATRTSSGTPSRPSSRARGSRMSGSSQLHSEVAGGGDARSPVAVERPRPALRAARSSSGSGSPTGPGASRP